MVDFKEASTIKVTNEHDVIDEALQSGGEKFTVFSIVSVPILVEGAMLTLS